MDDAANDRINGWVTFFKDAWKSLTCQSDKYPNFIFFVMDALNQWITSAIFLPQTAWDLLRGLFSFDPYTVGYSLGTTLFMIFETLLAKAIAEGLTALAEKLGVMESKIAGAGETNNSVTSLYRAVGPDEFYSIMKSGEFSVIPEGLQAKQFGLSFEETLSFANKYPDIGAIIEVKVPTDVLNKIGDFSQVDKFIFKNGTVTIHADQLCEFNAIIQEIIHRY